jgi:hypothetical protein
MYKRSTRVTVQQHNRSTGYEPGDFPELSHLPTYHFMNGQI